jgi:hypothetical protein
MSPRTRSAKNNLGTMGLDAFVAAIKAEIAEKRAELGVRP